MPIEQRRDRSARWSKSAVELYKVKGCLVGTSLLFVEAFGRQTNKSGLRYLVHEIAFQAARRQACARR